jgi:organic radical activating enzyme
MDKMIPLKVLTPPGKQSFVRSPSAGQAGDGGNGDGAGRLNGSQAGASAGVEPSSPTGGRKHVELSRIHDFASKLVQPDILPRVREYVRWHARLRGAEASGDEATLRDLGSVPEFAPVSINLDLTTACNYACDHCVDMDILNQPIKFDHSKLLGSIELMSRKGLRSVIVIGGGEPTVYPKFVEVIAFMKDLGLQVAVVSNGSGMKKIAEVAHRLDEADWIRLSLDSATDDTFQKMHKPRRAISLDEICEGVREIKKTPTRFKIGFSFIITWRGAFINDTAIVPNIQEIVGGAERARRYRFDYISYKPFLTRAPDNNAEIVDLKESDRNFDAVIARIRATVDEAKKLATADFQVYEATNLKVLENRSYRNYTEQPHRCHMQFFRQVLSPLGMYNCPVYRNQPHGFLGTKEAYADEERNRETRRKTAELIRGFDATSECSEVTCLYNHVNWWLEGLIEDPRQLNELEASPAGAEPDYFL